MRPLLFLALVLACAAAPLGRPAAPVLDDSLDEVGSFTASFSVYTASQFEALPGAIPGTVFPAPPPGFVPGTPTAAGDVGFVANKTNLTSITAQIQFLPASPVSAFVELRNGNYGVVQDVFVKWNGAASQDFSTAIFVGDVFALNGGSARFKPQIVPSLDAEGDFDEVRVLFGNPGPYVGMKLPIGYVIDNGPLFGWPDTPLRAWSLAGLGVMAPSAQTKIKIALDMGVPVESTSVGAPSVTQPLDRTTLTMPVTITYQEVTAQGETRLKTSTQGPPPPAGFKLGTPPTYYEISTSATFVGSITLCFDYSAVQYSDENALRLFHTSDGIHWTDITTTLDMVNDRIYGTTTSYSRFAVFEAVPDTDQDGLTDDVEQGLGTNPLDPDTDDDGLLDGTEVLIGTNALQADSDADGFSDGTEVTLGTNPLNADTDGDSVADGSDPLPTVPGVTSSYLEARTRLLAMAIDVVDLAVVQGPNQNAREGRRNALANHARNAANALAHGQQASAIDQLGIVLKWVDGVTPPPDWLVLSAQQAMVKAEVELLMSLAQI